MQETVRPKPESTVILVADDDPATLAVTARVLRIGGYEVIEASSGAEAESRTLAATPDVVLLDVDLGDADGREICARLKQAPSLLDTFFVLASGVHTSSDEQATGLEVGADGYIARPIGNRELLARVESFVRIRAAERERRGYETFLQRAHRLESLGALVSGIGREVNRPLAEALATAEQLRARLPADAALTDLADRVVHSCGQALQVVQSLARLSDASSQSPGKVDVGELVTEVLALVQAQLVEQDRILLISDVPSNLPSVLADRAELVQALAGLILQARDTLCAHFPGEHPAKQLRVSVGVRPGQRHVRVSIFDNGPGLSADAVEHIFDPFFAPPGPASRQGISLSLIRRTILEQRGDVTVEATYGGGTTFHVDLPYETDGGR